MNLCDHTRSDRIENAIIEEKVKVAFIKDKIREAKLKNFLSCLLNEYRCTYDKMWEDVSSRISKG